MFKNLKREVVYKSTIGKEVFNALLSAVLFTWLFCLCLTEFNHDLIDFFLTFQESNVNVWTFAFWIFPIFIIIFMSINLGRLVMLDALPKKKDSKVITNKKKVTKK